MENVIKYDVQNISVPIGTPAGLITIPEIKLNEAYKRCIGIAVVQITNGGQTRYDLGFKYNPSEVLADLQDRQMWLTPTSGVKVDELFKQVDFEITGQKSQVQLRTYGTIATTDLVLQVIYKLSKI